MLLLRMSHSATRYEGCWGGRSHLTSSVLLCTRMACASRMAASKHSASFGKLSTHTRLPYSPYTHPSLPRHLPPLRRRFDLALKKSYTGHAVLKLEPLVDELAAHDAQLARPLLELIRQNHYRSADHAKDVQGLFAPLKQRNAEELKRTSQPKAILEGVPGKKSQMLKLEGLVGHLDKAHAEDARAIFHVIRRNLTDGAAFAGELSRLFQPVKERNAEEWKRALRMKKVFDEVDQVSQLSGESFAHASQSGSRASMAGLGKRKRDE